MVREVMNPSFETLFSDVPVMLILRGYSFDRTLAACERAWKRGVTAVEIPVQSSDALATLERIADIAHKQGHVVGAGTVLTEREVIDAQNAGAQFTVSPGFDAAIAAACLDRGLPHLSGVATASEISQARRFGATWLKAFPARELGPGWVSAMRGPFPEMKFVATGGVNSRNARAFLDAGASAVSLGSAADDLDEIDAVLRVISEPGL